MPWYENGPVTIHYDVRQEGDGDFPVLLIAPGGMRSAAELWANAPWDPRAALAPEYRVIAMDQRNAGRSFGPIAAGDGWATYRDDQLGLLDHLGIERCHVVGMCIGGPYIIGLLTAAPERFAAAVLLQPVGIDDNRAAFHDMFDQWAEASRDRHADVADDTWRAFRSNMWDGDFVLTADHEQVAALSTPMLVAMGNDLYHPQVTSRRIVELAPNATLVESWKEGEDLVAVDATIRDFLRTHTP